MVAQYNNNGAYPRYACNRMTVDYAEPVCQTLRAAPLDALMVRLVLEALAPAALEASLLAAADLEREREAIERECERTRRPLHADATQPEERPMLRPNRPYQIS